ncbi:MAG: TIM barrel protein [Chloroflexota bacterium]|nr:TIM barrel protein [Chloroflexota bacterium]MDE2919724.1 TIM barrel protein [Chloroflexota bacterium]
MRLGLSADTYRWIAFPWMRADRPAFRASGHYAPHILSVTPPESGADVPDWLLDRVLVHGFTALTMDLGLLGSRSRASEFGSRCTDVGVRLLGSVPVDLVAERDRWGYSTSDNANAHFDPTEAGVLQSGWIGDSEASIAGTAIRLAADAGVAVLSLIHGQPDRANRYSPEPSLAEQLLRIESNVRTLLPLAADAGVTLALEPHMDYRCAELVPVVETIASAHLRLVLDVASPLAVTEDPLDAARIAAPYVAATHLRDMRMQALTEIATGALFHTPIGEGHIPVKQILDVVNDGAADPGSVIHCLKIVTRPEHDVEAWLAASAAAVRRYAARSHAPC